MKIELRLLFVYIFFVSSRINVNEDSTIAAGASTRSY